MSYDETDMMENVVENCLKGWNCNSIAISYLEKQLERGYISEERQEEVKQKIKKLK